MTQTRASIVVAYFPQEERLLTLLEALSSQCFLILTIANSPASKSLREVTSRSPRHHLIENQTNVGLAAAQNQGIRAARARGAEWLLFFDQDSVPRFDHVEKLVSAHESLALQGHRVAAIGPHLWDTHAGAFWPFHEVDWWQLREVRVPSVGRCAQLPYVVSSGSLIRMSVFDAVGDFDESLFIDNIDVEWGFRASDMGYKNFGYFDLVMQHTIGDRQIRFLGKIHPLHSQQRHYFMFRSSIRLMKLEHVPTKWKANELLRMIPRLLVYSVFSDKPIKHLCAGILGIVDGALGRPVNLRWHG